MHSRLSWCAALGFLLFSPILPAGEGAAVPVAVATAPGASGSSPVVSEMLLTGIAAIGETRFIYLTHVSGTPSVEVKTGSPSADLEILRVHDEGPTASWRVLVRSQGREYWLSFAPASLVPTGSGLATGIPAAIANPAAPPSQTLTTAATPQPEPPAIKAPAQNAGTFSNDPAHDTPVQARKRRNNFPLPPGL